VPLSEHEQRLFEQIEKSLAEDPKFASAVRSTDPRFRGRRKLVFAGLVGVAGLAVVVLGAVRQNTLLGVAGFVCMMLAAGFAIQSRRRAHSVELRAVDGTATRRTGSGNSFISRLEARWRDRPEGD
jgi:hypothetical protein